MIGDRLTRGPSSPWWLLAILLAETAFFIFIFFKNIFTEIYFWFHNLQFYIPTARQGATARLRGGRPPTARWRGGRQADRPAGGR